MRVKDLYKDGKGIFYYINECEPLPFTGIMDTELLDIMFNSLHGSREISPLVRNVIGEDITEDNLKVLGSVVWGMYFNKWDKILKIYLEDLPLETYNLVTTEKVDDLGEAVTDIINEATNSDITSVTGYNDDEFNDDDKLEKSSNDTSKNTSNTTSTRDKVTTVSGNTSNALDDRFKAIDYLKNTIIYDIMFVDVGRLLGLQIY